MGKATEIRSPEFFARSALTLAPELIGKLLCRRLASGEVKRLRITESECYMGGEDLACHASKGRTKRTEVMFWRGGYAYVYLVYGMHWLMNIVTGRENHPEAVLIRCCEGWEGPAKLTKALAIDGSLYGTDMTVSDILWLEDDGHRPEVATAPRVGVSYAGEYWAGIPWRFLDAGRRK